MMKTLFKTLFWTLIFFSALSIDNASVEQICYEMFFLAILILPTFYYEDLKTYLNKQQ